MVIGASCLLVGAAHGQWPADPSAKPSSSQRQLQGARQRLQADWNAPSKQPKIVSEPETISLNAVPNSASGHKKSGPSTKSPRLANGKSLDDLNLSEGQVVVLDDKGNIVESYVEGKDGKKTPIDPAKLMKRAGMKPVVADTPKPDGKAPVATTSPPKTTAKKPGFLGRLFGKGRSKDAASDDAVTQDSEIESKRVSAQSRRPALR